MILQESDYVFLADCFEKFPEAKLLLTPASVTSDGETQANIIEDMVDNGFLPSSAYDPEHHNAMEFNRTLTGLLVYHWLRTGDYESFTANQNKKIEPALFHEMRDFALQLENDLLQTEDSPPIAIIGSLIMHDLGKSRAIIELNLQRGEKISDDHDDILADSLAHADDQLQGLARLDVDDKNLIIESLRSGLNIAHFIHAECSDEEVEKINSLSDKARHLHLLTSLCDIGGAFGHQNPRGSFVLDGRNAEVIFKAVSILNDHPDQKAAQEYRKWRASLLPNMPDVNSPEGEALIRTAMIGRRGKGDDANDINNAWKSLDKEARDLFTKALTHKITPSMKLTYLPQTFVNLTKHFTDKAPEDQLVAKTEAAEAFIKAVNTLTEQIKDALQNPNKGISVNLCDFSAAAKLGPNELDKFKVVLATDNHTAPHIKVTPK